MCSGFRVQGIWCRVQGSGYRVQGSGFRVWGSGFRVQGSREKVGAQPGPGFEGGRWGAQEGPPAFRVEGLRGRGPATAAA